ncbi:Cation proton exchanger [Hibiscus syriacus]|uniref:Cation proton exchanger n=1 Tax=Hibiscus syriacus TaxID=106335 RepID=A0A6A3BI55_HIBSY|nr:Cation proton exchanger [Hibiscus syriacus]
MANGTLANKGHRPTSGPLDKYTVKGGLDNQFNVCFKANRTVGFTEWQATSPLMTFLPSFMAGILLGPTFMQAVPWLAIYINPPEGVLLLETMGSLGVTFYMFLVGLDMDLTPIRKMEKTAYSVAIVGTILPGCGGMMLYYLVQIDREDAPMVGGFFWAIALTVTSFPDLTRILSKLKLMSTDLGKTAMASAVLTDLVSWILLVATIALVNGHGNVLRIFPTLIFMLLCWFVIRPLLFRMIKRIGAAREDSLSSSSSSMEGQCSDKHVEGIGTKIMDKIEEFVVGIMMPPVFLVAGLRTNIFFIAAGYHYWLVATVIIVASLIKIIGTLIVCAYLKCSFRDSLALGVLMNTKGVIAIIVLQEGRNVKGFDQPTFTWMMLSILIMTSLVVPIVSCTHKSARHLKQQHRMNLERSKPESELRVLACLHSSKNLSGLINLLHLSNATRKSPIVVFAVYLIELTGRASAMLIFHDKIETNDIPSNPTRERAESEQIVRAFESLQNDNRAVTVHPLTAVSPYATMHEDVSNLVIDKHVAVILLPYHKKPNGIGGADDREALAYAWRMGSNPRLTLTVVRFVPGKDLLESVADDDDADLDVFSAMFEKEKEKLLDDDYINEFRFRTMHNESITYMEKPVNSGDQIVSTITSAHNDYDLYIVGRGYGRQSPLTSGLSDWSEFPEIGLIGDTLISVDSLTSASVLVMQQSPPVAAVSQKGNTSGSNKGLS